MLGRMRSCAWRMVSIDTVTEEGADATVGQYTLQRCFVEQMKSKSRPSWGLRQRSSILGRLVWLLSPISRWNDQLVNVP